MKDIIFCVEKIFRNFEWEIYVLIIDFIFGIFSLLDLIFGATPCRIENTKDQNITNFEGCQSFSKAISENVCCYVQGKGENETSISACAELSPKVNDYLKNSRAKDEK